MIRVLILGYGPMGLALSRAVVSCSHMAQLVAVFPWSQKHGERYQRHEVSERHFKWFLKQNNIPVINTFGVNHYSFTEILTSLKPDLVLVGSWGEIFEPHVLNMPDITFVNCHPSYLPFHRGPNPYVSVILSGESHSGITFHIISEEIDAGPVIMQKKLMLTPFETGGSLRERCAGLAEAMVPELLEKIVQGKLEIKQQSAEGSYISINNEVSWIRWNDSPEKIERRIRAIYPWFDNLTCLGRYKICFGWGKLCDFEEKNTKTLPGRIIRRVKEGILVETIDPSQALLLKNPRFLNFPSIFGSIFSGYFFKPGRCFHSPV